LTPAAGIAARNAVVVVPTFNERRNIARLVETLFSLYPEIHLLVVDDHSPDGTADAVRELQPRYPNLILLERMRDRGFAASYRDGFQRALAEPWCQAVLTMDADFSHDPSEIRHLLEKLAGNDVVLGSRYVEGGGVGHWNLRRRILSRSANFYVRTVLGLGAHDATSGFMCLRREALQRVPVHETVSDGYAFLVELKYLLGRSGCRIAEHPIVFDERREGQSKMSADKIWEAVWLPWHTRFRFRPASQETLRPPQAPGGTVDRRNILLCMAVFLLAVAATNPVLEMGFIDDWSYARIAREFAATGHFAYNGWTAVPLLPQIVWASAFIKLFGFSFFIVRLSTVVLGLFLIPLLYRLGRESGLAPPFAAFATLLSVLSPLTMPEAVSFMSDVPAFFLFALCFYGGVKSWKAASAKDCVRWAGLIVLAGVLSGLDRQIYWLAPLLFLPVIAWIQRRKNGVPMWLGFGWLASLSAVAYSVYWFQAQPYTLVEEALKAWKRHGFRYAAANELSLVAEMAATVVLILFPLLAAYVAPGFKTVSRKTAPLVLAGLLAGGFGVRHVFHRGAPWMGNVLTERGIYSLGVGNLDLRPVILGRMVRDLVAVGVFLSCAGCGLALWKYRPAAGARSWHRPATPALVLGLVFTAAWLATVLYRAAASPAYDRYLIPLLPVVAIPLLRHYQVYISRSVSRWSWAILALFAWYGVATTHDWFASARARLAATRILEQAGLPRSEIQAGFEYDGWTQLEAAGYVINPLLRNPAGAYRPKSCTGPKALRSGFRPMTPAVRARYFVVFSRLPELVDGPFAPVRYTTWLPPGPQEVFTQIIPGGGYAGCQ
jgi:dolichol-phosphate mannosyltransferase